MLSELKRRRGPFWKRALEIAGESWRRRSAARAAARVSKPLPFVKVPRSRLEAALSARVAVRAGVRLDDFLRQRLAKYATRLPVALEDLPVLVDVENGEPVVRARPQPMASAAASLYAAPQRTDEAARWMRSLVEREGPFAARQIREAEAELAALDARAAASRARAETLAHQLADDLAAGKVPGPPRVDATPEQLGRPPVPPLWPIASLRLFILALVVGVAWFFSGPILATQGLADAELLGALRDRPLPAGMSLVLALGAAAAVFAFASVALQRADALLAGDGSRRRALLVLAALAAAALAAGVAAAAITPGRLALLALLVVVPFAGAVLLRAAARMDGVRGDALDAALAWDRALARDVAERARRTEIVDQARADLDRTELERAEARRRLHLLEKRAVDAEHAAAGRARAEARRLDRLAESLAAALELDRYAFVRLASSAAQEALMRPMRRLEPAVAPERLGIAR